MTGDPKRAELLGRDEEAGDGVGGEGSEIDVGGDRVTRGGAGEVRRR